MKKAWMVGGAARCTEPPFARDYWYMSSTLVKGASCGTVDATAVEIAMVAGPYP